MRLTVANTTAIVYACENFHYAKATPAVQLAFNVFNDDNEWCGVICYGSGATPHIASPYHKWQGQIIELERVALNGKQGTTSQALAMSLKMVHKMCPMVDMIVSYADLDQEHAGIIYQATNWIYTGINNEGSRGAFIIHGKKMHPKSVHAKGWKQSLSWLRENVDPDAEEFITAGKHKYLFPFDKKLRKQVEKLRKPYPKKKEVEDHE